MIEGQGKSQYALYPTPGLSKVLTVGSGASPVEALVGQPGLNFLNGISGPFYFQLQYLGPGNFGVLQTNSFTRSGSPAVQLIAGAGANLMTVDGNVFYDLAGAGTTPLAAATFGNKPVSQVAYCSSFFLALNANSNQIWVSNAGDVTTWNALATAKVSIFPDNVVSMVVNQNDVWLLGQTASAVYYPSGDSPFPFAYRAGSYIENGCVAAASAVKLDNSIFWLGQDARGHAIVWRAVGYTPQRVSNHAVEFAMQGYPALGRTIAYAYQDQGHTFYVMYFPLANNGNGATWVYDVATQQWHERCFLNPANGQEYAHRSQSHLFFNAADGTNYHLVGDWQNTGNIYQMAIPSSNGTGGYNFATDFGNPIKRLRRAPHVNIEKEWMFHSRIDFDMETGLGPIPALPGQSTAPSVVNLADPNGAVWAYKISDNLGVFIATSTTQPAQTIILNDSNPNVISTSYKLISFVGGGGIGSVHAPYLPIYPLTFTMTTGVNNALSGPGSYLPFNQYFLNAFPQLQLIKPSSARDPQIMLRWSDDGGHTWSNQYFISAGQAGKYKALPFKTRLGRARQRIYELQCTDPIPWRITNAYLKATAFAVEERLATKLAKSA